MHLLAHLYSLADIMTENWMEYGPIVVVMDLLMVVRFRVPPYHARLTKTRPPGSGSNFWNPTLLSGTTVVWDFCLFFSNCMYYLDLRLCLMGILASIRISFSATRSTHSF